MLWSHISLFINNTGLAQSVWWLGYRLVWDFFFFFKAFELTGVHPAYSVGTHVKVSGMWNWWRMICLHLMAMLRLLGHIPPLPHMPLCLGQRQLSRYSIINCQVHPDHIWITLDTTKPECLRLSEHWYVFG